MSLKSLGKDRLTLVFAMAVAVAAAFGARAEAQVIPDGSDRPAFGLFGIARGQSARLNVSVGNTDLLPAGPCHVTLGFVNDSNQPLAGRRGGTTTAEGTVNPGGSLSLEIHSNEVFNTGDGQRKLLRAVAVGNTDLLPAGPCRGFAATLEILDSANGATSVLYAPTTDFTAPPEPELPPFGLVDVVRGQAAELHVFISNPDLRTGAVATDNGAACHVSLAFVDNMGTPLFDRGGRMVATTGVLVPGQSLTLSLASADLFRPGDARQRGIRAVVTGEQDARDLPAGPCHGLVPTMEIVDGQGQTSILYAASQVVTVGAPPPGLFAEITFPQDGDTFLAGQTITLNGSTTGATGNVMLAWTITLSDGSCPVGSCILVGSPATFALPLTFSPQTYVVTLYATDSTTSVQAGPITIHTDVIH